MRRTFRTAVVLVWLMPALAQPARASGGGEAATAPVPRTVLALYDSTHHPTPDSTLVHVLAEMPLNHLGLVVRYHDLRRGLPAAASLHGVRGVVTWFTDDAMPDPAGYLQWLDGVIARRIPVAVMGSLGAFRDPAGRVTPLELINATTSRLGWRHEAGWHTTTYGARYTKHDERILEFERPLPVVVPPFGRVARSAPDARVALSVSVGDRPAAASDLVILTPRGAYVAPGYEYFADRERARDFRQWHLNPFEFFRAVFSTDELPKPDTATLSGRRIFYSHIDGDGWRSLTRVEPYRTRYLTAARVVLEELVRPAPDFPVTMAVVVGDIDPAWHGTKDSLQIAREIFQLPHVGAGIHTYSHPFDWSFFADARANEQAYAANAHQIGGGDVLEGSPAGGPRAYTRKPFSLAIEIDAAAAFVNRLLPPGKRVDLVQWPGDTRPFEAAVARARQAGLANINGGDTRFDREFPSAAWISPLGRRVGHELQVYASNSNENTYTDLWRDRFFGFSFLKTTVEKTGAPRRLKPYNLYYHVYSGDRLSSLNAVRANLAYARTLSLAPIEASRYSRVVEGFFTASIDALGPRRWRIRDRGALQTIRFDGGTLDGVDFSQSRGVIGQRHELGCLYVSLDETEPEPIIALKPVTTTSREPREATAYLIESRWRVFGVTRTATALHFTTQGYGTGESSWTWPDGGTGIAWVRWTSDTGNSGQFRAERTADGRLRLRLPALTAQRLRVDVRFLGRPAHGR